jgi:hypothetical protein
LQPFGDRATLHRPTAYGAVCAWLSQRGTHHAIPARGQEWAEMAEAEAQERERGVQAWLLHTISADVSGGARQQYYVNANL